MQIVNKKILKNITILILIQLVICISISKYSYADNDTKEIIPQENQYMELRATTINTIDGKDKQIIFELWSYNIEFAGVDVRFSYDGMKFATSNLLNNDYTNDENEFFMLESKYANKLELFTVENKPNEIRAVLSFNPPVNEEDEIKNENGKLTIDTTGGVLLGKMSFRMKDEDFNISSFKLKESETSSPKTGIKINIDGVHYYQQQSTFIFTDRTSSKDAYLSDLIVSSGIKDEQTPENSTYKEYELTPVFDKETLKYEITLMENIDTINIKLTQNDSKSTIKMKVPKRDENNKLQYEEDGQTIIYEEKQIQVDQQQEVILNKLGEPDTIITIIVTAEDGEKINNYELTIKRPYGIIKGKVITTPTATTTQKHKATVRVYKTEEVNKKIDWSSLQPGISDNVHQTLLTINSLNVETNDDGTYEIYVIPGTYSILLDKIGYLDQVITSKQTNNGETIDIGEKTLLPRRCK